MTQTTRNFSPDGMRGPSEMGRRHEVGAGHRDQKGEQKSHHHGSAIEVDQSHDFYDDGLVHSHHWAASN
jgi:hypothetical protein